MKKRTRGKGVYQRGSIWYTDFLSAETDKAGKLVRRRIRMPLPGMGKTEAELHVAEIVGKVLARKRAIKEGRAESELTLREYVSAFFPWGKVKRGSREHYSEMKTFEKHIFPALGDRKLTAILPGHISDFRTGLPSDLAPDTKNNVMSLLKRVFHRARSMGHISHVPGFPPALEVETLELQLTADEEARLLAAFDDRTGFARSMSRKVVRHGKKLDVVFPGSVEAAYTAFRRSKPLFVIALQTGLTRGDLLGLTWKQITPDGVKGRRRKTKKEYTSVFPDPALAKAALSECRMGVASASLVFVTAEGTPYTERSLARYWAKALTLSGIKARDMSDDTKRMPRFHDTRHTFATRWLEKGASLDVIGRMLGHSPKTWAKTVARYAKATDAAVLAQTRALLRK